MESLLVDFSTNNGNKKSAGPWMMGVNLKIADFKKYIYFFSNLCVCRLAQSSGHFVAPQPRPPGVWLDLWTCQLIGLQSKVAGCVSILLSPLQ